jgi:hypothetical protein
MQIKLYRTAACQAKNNDILKASVEDRAACKHPFALPLAANLRYNVAHSQPGRTLIRAAGDCL